MTKETLTKIVQAVSCAISGIDFINAHSFSKVYVDTDTIENDMITTIYDGYRLPLDKPKQGSIMLELLNDETNPLSDCIMIYKTVIKDGTCIGYRYLTHVPTHKRTLIQITAELTYEITTFVNMNIW